MTTEQINRIFAIVNNAMEHGVDAIQVHTRVNQTIERLEACLSADINRTPKTRLTRA